MRRKTLFTILIILKLLKGTLSQDDSKFSLQSFPAYAVVGPGGNSTGNLLCMAHYNEDNPPRRSWMTQQSYTLVTYGDEALVDGYSASLTESNEEKTYHFSLKLNPLRLANEGQYICQISINKSSKQETVDLHINQFPINRIKMLKTEVLVNNQATVAACHADLAKPPPELWFENAKGKRIDDAGSPALVKACDNGLTNSTIYLTRHFAKEDMDDTYYCKIKHVNSTQPFSKEVDHVYVLYPPTAKLRDNMADVILEEGSHLSVYCETSGYPEPTINWTFTPDQALQKSDGGVRAPGSMPNNFMITDSYHRISTHSVKTADGDVLASNNGTFTCTASNGIGAPVTASFRLTVFATPTTTVPPTTPVQSTLTEDTSIIPAASVQTSSSCQKNEPTPALRQAGPNAAVIAGIVAVAVFILIVTVILLLRYFMSHKGEYYTNELKTEAGKQDVSDDDDSLSTNEGLLGEKMRTEHFL